MACQAEPIPKVGFLPLEAQHLLPAGLAGAGFSTHWAHRPGSFFPEPKSRMCMRNKRETDLEKAENYPSDTQYSNECRGLQRTSLPMDNQHKHFHPTWVAFQEDQELQLPDLVGGHPALSAHSSELPALITLHLHTGIPMEIVSA